MQSAKPFAIFLSFDENYLAYAKPCLHSLLCNYPNHPTILINYSGRNKSFLKEYTANNQIRFIDLGHHFDFTPGPIDSITVYDRFHLWSNYFSEFSKILHLDADTIVLKPLDKLFEEHGFFITRDDQHLARVFKIHDALLPKERIVLDTTHLQSMLKLDNLEHFSNSGTMANAGVFLIPKEFRSDDHYQQLINLAKKYDALVAYADQSIISIWCSINNITIQDKPEFNCQIRFLYTREIDISDVFIMHFSGEAKFYDALKIHYRYKSLYRECDALRLFYRKQRIPGDDATIRKRIEHLIQNLRHLEA